MNDRIFDLFIDLVALAVSSGYNVCWRGNVITITRSEDGAHFQKKKR